MTTVAKDPRELILIDQQTVVAAQAFDWKAIHGVWCRNPRFILVVSNLTGAGQGIVKIEDCENKIDPFPLHDGIVFAANGSYVVRTEELHTRFPLHHIRANLATLDAGVTSVTLVMRALFDKAPTPS